ncbi:MAG TPA: transglutaminase-like domain-containing protein [Gemmatimonadales bacterium]
MTWLVIRQISRPPEAFLEAAAARLAPSAAFYQILLNGVPMGNAGITLDTVFTGYRVTEVWSMDLAGPTRSHRHVYRSDAELSRSLKLQTQVVNLSEAGVPRILELQQGDSLVTLEERRPGGQSEAAQLGGRSITIAAGLVFRLAAEKRLERGASVSRTVALPMMKRSEVQSARVIGDAVMAVSDSAVWDSTRSDWVAVPAPGVTAWQVERTWGGMPMIEWVDAQGRLLQRSWAFGLTLERSPFEVNYNRYQAALRGGRISLPQTITGARARTSFAGAPDTTIRELVIHVARLDGPAWPGSSQVFQGGRQAVSHDTVTVRRRGKPIPGSTQPDQALMQATGNRSAGEAYARALAAMPEGSDTLAHLVQWVSHSVRLVDDSSTTSVQNVAATRMGGARGKVALLVEFARLAGKPARPVIGVDAGRPELPSHIWAEVWEADQWIAVDPVYGHVPAAASLLRVSEGPDSRPLALVPLVASLRTTILAVRR